MPYLPIRLGYYARFRSLCRRDIFCSGYSFCIVIRFIEILLFYESNNIPCSVLSKTSAIWWCFGYLPAHTRPLSRFSSWSVSSTDNNMGYFIDSQQPLHKLSQTFQMAGCMNGSQLENLQISPGLLYFKRESPDPAQDYMVCHA